MKTAKRVVTKKPSNAGTGSQVDPKDQKAPKKPKTKARILGQDLRKLKRRNPAADQSMRRPGLVTTKGPG